MLVPVDAPAPAAVVAAAPDPYILDLHPYAIAQEQQPPQDEQGPPQEFGYAPTGLVQTDLQPVPYTVVEPILAAALPGPMLFICSTEALASAFETFANTAHGPGFQLFSLYAGKRTLVARHGVPVRTLLIQGSDAGVEMLVRSEVAHQPGVTVYRMVVAPAPAPVPAPVVVG